MVSLGGDPAEVYSRDEAFAAKPATKEERDNPEAEVDISFRPAKPATKEERDNPEAEVDISFRPAITLEAVETKLKV